MRAKKEILKLLKKELLDEYIRKTPKSKKLFDEAREVIPGGIGSAARHCLPYPIFVDIAKGSKIWDVDGNEYIDYIMAYGALAGGHSHPAILEAIREKLENGTMYGMPHAGVIKLVRELLRRYPMLDEFRLTNSGIESNIHAIRVARAYTGKDKIVKMEGAYHGSLDDLLVSLKPPLDEAGPREAPNPVPHSAGIPKDTIKNTLVAPFNDADVLDELLRRHDGEVAAVIMEPMLGSCGVVQPKKGYLGEVRKLTRDHNVLLIFDEIKTGVRMAPGGASEYYHVDPDIVTLAKAIGGGNPIGAFGGKREIMELVFPVGNTFHSSTFADNPIAVAAAEATLCKILTDNAYHHARRINDQLSKGARDLAESSGVEVWVSSVSSFGYIYFMGIEPVDYRTAMKTDLKKTLDFWFKMVNEGVFIWSPVQFQQWNTTVTHSEEDVEKTLEKMDTAFKKIKQG